MSPQSKRPFHVLGVQQIAIGASSRSSLRQLWIELLGGTPKETFVSERENVDEEILQLGVGALAFELDLMQPLDVSKKPRVDVPPLNHFGLWIDDLNAAVAWLEEKGVRFTPGGIRKGASGHDVCFIHPKENESHPVAGGGVLIELVQAPPELISVLTAALTIKES